MSQEGSQESCVVFGIPQTFFRVKGHETSGSQNSQKHGQKQYAKFATEILPTSFVKLCPLVPVTIPDPWEIMKQSDTVP